MSENTIYDNLGTMWSETEPTGEEVVITGIAGRFPESDNITQLRENLFNKVDLITRDGRRWQLDHPEIPQRSGKINNLEKFDSEFFGMHFVQAHTLDPMCRMALEHAYEAIIDAGVNPRQLHGSNTGIFMGACISESETTWIYEKSEVKGSAITGCSRATLANQISQCLGFKGPSYCVDAACSSSFFALDHAYQAIRSGQCDAALVGGVNLCLHPYVSLQFFRLGVLSLDGRCKSFDAGANGYARSESIAMIFLQKSKDAKRVYSRVIHTKTNCDGYKEQGITFPSSELQRVLLEEFYKECRVPPSLLSFVEAHGTGTVAGDPEELDAIEKIFCPGRTTPLSIGTIKSNLGHSEGASGICSIAKVIIGMESGYIPPNLHYTRPREGLKALKDGRMKVITEPTPWEGGYVGVNSFGFGGANCHVLLKSNPKEKLDGGKPKDNLPRLVVVSGRTEEAVTTLLDHLENKPTDVEFVGLLHGIHAEEIPGHLYRGYTILPTGSLPENKTRDVVQHYPGAKRPVWFVFSGMGSEWAGMGEALLKIPVFATAIRKCEAALKPHGVNIEDILTNKDPETFDNILNSFVGIAAVQIGLVDVLESIGIRPTNIIGHSVGELGCAYADGCLTAEQTVLTAYFRGLALMESKLIQGSMAIVGLDYDKMKDLCPSDIAVACHNSSGSSTIGGPVDSMRQFVTKLQANNILTEEVPCSNIAYHSRYVAAAGTKVLAYLEKVIPNPKPRSEKWLSTSVPRDMWNTSAAQLSSPEYHTNNLLRPVLFEETFNLIPKDAIAIEIAPHGLLQAILRGSLNENVTNIVLMKRGHKDIAQVLLQAIGNMYEVGLYPQLSKLYPEVEYPVSRGTPSISPLIRWDHSDDWYVSSYRMQRKISTGIRTVQVTYNGDTDWVVGHMIDGRNLIPATGYLTFIWETLGMIRGELYTEVSTVFENVRFHRATSVPKQGGVELTLMLQKGSGRFEVVEGGTAVVTGLVRAVASLDQERVGAELPVPDNEELQLKCRDIYKEFRLRGYEYTGMFRGLKEATLNGCEGWIEWNNNWAAFMDNMLQMKLLGFDTRGLFVPTAIQKLVIDTQVHLNRIHNMPEEDRAFPVHVDRDLDIIVSGGVEIKGLQASAIARKKPAGDPVLEEFHFVAHRDRAVMPLEKITRIATHIALDNHRGVKVQTIEVIDEGNDISPEDLTSPLIQEVLGDLPLIQANVNIIAPIDKYEKTDLPSTITISDLEKISGDFNALLVVGYGLLANKNRRILKQMRAMMKDGGFLLAREPLDADSGMYSFIDREGFDLILEKRTEVELVLLLHRREQPFKIMAVIKIRSTELTWLSKLQAALKAEREKESSIHNRILVVAEGDFESGLMGLVNCLRKEPGGEIIHGLLIQDMQAPEFSLENALYAEQLQLGLPANVLRPRKTWGSYRFFKLNPLPSQPVYHARISQPIRGDLSSLTWVQGSIHPGSPQKDLIKIYYSSMNFRDVMMATGKLAVEAAAASRQAQENVIGFEFAGMDVRGNRLMGLVHTGSISNLCFCDRGIKWSVPDKWTLEEAATVPAVYGTAYYALEMRGKMKKGDKVLIHAGSGGVGQAAIRIALHTGCEVFTTVGTPQKREFIMEQFPQIDDAHIGNSRDAHFEQWIMHQTHGRGVDIVLNSLAEEKLQASVRCLAHGGRFLEIGKFDLAAGNPLGMEAFLKGISFHGIFIDSLFTAGDKNDIKKARVFELVNQGIRNGAVKPLVRTVFPMNQVEAAFRYMAAGKHIGKVILKIRDLDEDAQPPLPLALPRYYCSEDRSYLILGGLGGFGLELADWLVLRGAKKVVLTSRRGITNGYQKLRIDLWKSYGVKVVVVAGKDAWIHEDCEDILKQAAALGPVDAIFNLAVVLKDALFENQTPDTFEESLRVKAWATKQLDKLSRILCPDLRQFVVFSSVSCGRGNAGQTNYGMANSIMERICETRAAENLPGLAIQWGAIGDVGLVAEMQEDFKEVVIGGTLQQKISSCLEELDGFLNRKGPIISSMVVAEKSGAGGAGATNIIDAVVNIMGLKDLKTVSFYLPLAELGMDSMMAVEIKQTLEREFGVFLTAQDIRALNFAKLQEMSFQLVEQENRRVKKASDQMEDLVGMKLLFHTIGTDSPDTNICVPLITNAEDGREEIFVLPGIESSYTVFQSLAGRLKSPTTCLQLGTSPDLLSIDDMVDYLMPHVKARLKERTDFAIAGYSFGSLIAIELARRLEADGLRGRLVLIDGSPEYMKALLSQHLSLESDDQLQSKILLGIMDILAPAFTQELDKALRNCNDWNQRLLAFVSTLSTNENLNFPQKDQEAICTSVYHRFRAIVSYDCSKQSPLKTPITLLRPKIQAVRLMPEDYGLRALTQEKVEVHFVEGNHSTMLEDDICASAINGDRLSDGVTSIKKSIMDAGGNIAPISVDSVTRS